MQQITLKDLTRSGDAGSFGHRFFCILEDGRELSLETCMNGYDVAIYDDKQDLIGEKTCTNIDFDRKQMVAGFSIVNGKALEKALKIANKMLKDSKYEYQRV